MSRAQSQQAVDDLTMRIEARARTFASPALTRSPQNKHLIRGSGFIQFPPQVPFKTPVVVQPPTIAVRARARAPPLLPHRAPPV